MADTSAATGLVQQNFDAKFYIDFLRKSRFSRYMRKDQEAPIVLREDLTKQKGDSITLALVNELTGAGVTASSTLEGNEEALDSRSMKVTVDQFRHAVRVPMLEKQFSSIDLMVAARSTLLNWRLAKHKDNVVNALGSINGVAYASASEANKDAWLVDNGTGRTMFGDITVTAGFTDHSAELANIASTEKASASNIAKLKRAAQNASPIIKPFRIDELDEEFYLLFCSSNVFRDLQADTTIATANREARPREVMSNPIFTGGSLLYEGIIIVHIPEIATLGGVGTCSALVDPTYLCGSAALTYVVAERPSLVNETFDYGDKHGVAVKETSVVVKNIFGSGSGDTDDLLDHGMATAYFAAALDV